MDNTMAEANVRITGELKKILMEPGARFKFLPATEELRETFGGVDSQTGEEVSATVRLCRVYDILNEIIIKGFLHPCSVSEEEAIPSCLSDPDMENKLFLFDRGYPGYRLMYLLMETGYVW